MSTNIVVLGGGTGTSTIARGLKMVPGFIVNLVVSVGDGGGSSGLLREAYNVIPPGDIGQGLEALSMCDKNVRELLRYRFSSGPLAGHTLGNLLLVGAMEKYGDPKTGIRVIQELFRVRGQVIPVSSVPATLIADLHDGTVLHGEEVIDDSPQSQRSPIRACHLEDPDATASFEAQEALRCADVIFVGPGDLVTSLSAALLPLGIAAAIVQNKHALLVYVMNMMTKRGQTQDFTASKHLQVASRYTGRRFDAVLLHDAERYPFPPEAIAHYAMAGEAPVKDDLKGQEVIRTDLLSSVFHQQAAEDKVRRGLIGHDSRKLAEAILQLIANPPNRRPPTDHSAPPASPPTPPPANVP